MGYITLAEPADDARRCRSRGTPKAARSSSPRSAGSPSGSATTPQGQGHRTVFAQVVADALGVDPTDVEVAHRDRHLDHAVDGRIRELLVALLGRRRRCGRGARQSGSRRRSRRSATTSATRARRSAGSPGSRTGIPSRCRPGWSPGSRRRRTTPRRTCSRRMPRTASRRRRPTASSPTSPSSRSTARPARSTVLDYVTVHDAGRLLNPLLAEGQVRGGFAHGAARRSSSATSTTRTATSSPARSWTTSARPRRTSRRLASGTESRPRRSPARREGARRGDDDERARRDRERGRRRARTRRRRAAVHARRVWELLRR